MVYARNGQEVPLLGTATLTANFNDQQIAGQITDMFGGTGLADLRNCSGSLDLTGQIGLRRPNSFDIVVSGVLTAGGQTIALSGPLRGDFGGEGRSTADSAPRLQRRRK